MTDKRDEPKGGERRPSEGTGGGVKRPFATLDLQAQEVAATGPAAAQGASRSDTATSADKSAVDTDQRAAQAQSAAAARVAAAAAAMRQRPSPGPDTGKAAGAGATGARASGAAADRAKRAGAIGRYGSQLATGILGGLLALLGSHLLSPSSTPPTGNAGRLDGLSQRLTALEKSAGPGSQTGLPADAAQRLQAAEAGLARLDEITRRIDALRQSQARLAEQTRATQEALNGKAGTAGGIPDKIEGMEKRLSALAAVAASDPQAAGRMAQLTQLTGRINDLETALTSRLAALRSEMEARLAPAANAGEAAKSGAERLDREMSGVKSEAAQLGQRLTDLKASTEQQDKALNALRTDTSALKASLGRMKSDLEARLAAAAKPDDIAAAVAPVGEKIASLESNLKGVVRAEEERKANAHRIVLSIELNALKRAMERGGGYASELAAVEKVAGEGLQLGPLQRYQHDGVPSQAELLREFRPVANAILDADAEAPDASLVDRLLSGARTIVRVRKTTHATNDDSAEAIVGRMESALKEGRLEDVLAEAKRLPAKAAVPAQDWLHKIEARRAVDAALAKIDASLKASLGSAKDDRGQRQ